jgi:hypothetical protein
MKWAFHFIQKLFSHNVLEIYVRPFPSFYPQLLMRKGVPVDGVLWLDTFARRVEHLKKEDRNRNLSLMDLWPREWRECHLQFSKWVFESSKAKVWVIHGRVNREI